MDQGVANLDRWQLHLLLLLRPFANVDATVPLVVLEVDDLTIKGLLRGGTRHTLTVVSVLELQRLVPWDVRLRLVVVQQRAVVVREDTVASVPLHELVPIVGVEGLHALRH